jgi:phenylacetate-CoA ligase
MSSIRQKIYWKAPYLVKNLMASINGIKLDHQRFGPDCHRMIEEITEHDKWSAEQFRQYQCAQLQSLIRHISETVPYYQKMFAEKGINPQSITKPEDLQRLPILEKAVARSSSTSLLDQALNEKKLIVEHTAGTTGTPMTLYRDVSLNSTVWAFSEARGFAFLGMSRRRRTNRFVSVGGHLVTEPHRTKPPFWVHNSYWNQLYMSSYHLLPKYLGYYVDEIRSFKPDFIQGYPSSVYAIAQFIVNNNIEPVLTKACFTTAENLFDQQREIIKKAFGCKTYNHYGCGEMAIFAMECPYGSMHLSPEVAIVEVVDENDKLLPPGQIGQLIGTSLINRVQPFVRYRIGDIGALAAEQNCPCGSSLPIIKYIGGRNTDTLYSTERGTIGSAGLSTALYKMPQRFVMSQIEQIGKDSFIFRYVPEGNPLNKQEISTMLEELHNRLGISVEIKIEAVENIERTAAGKFRAVLCSKRE